jgi:hypothetical protein
MFIKIFFKYDIQMLGNRKIYIVLQQLLFHIVYKTTNYSTYKSTQIAGKRYIE